MKLKIFAAACFAALLSKAQNYGEITYAHTGHTLCSGITTNLNSTGFLTGLFQPLSAIETPNFIIDKTNDNGTFTGGFSRWYMTIADPNCGTSTSQILDCSGVSVIEINPVMVGPAGSQASAEYAVVGANSSGTFFSLLGANGVPLIDKLYTHNGNAGTPTKPFIFESSSTPGEFIICGTFNGDIYAMRVDISGSILWSTYYTSVCYYKKVGQILECPYSGDLTLVGWAGFSGSPNRATDGYFMKIDQNTGAVNVLETIGHPVGACNEFNAIAVANSTWGGSNGFIIGGYSDPVSGNGTSWFVKLDPSGNPVWNHLIQSSNSSWLPIEAVFERLNQGGNYEYFGVGNCFGYDVLKLDDGGTPFAAGNNEFVYTAPASNSWPNSMSYIPQGASSPNEGFHVFGWDDFTANASYQVSAYFNGVSGCEQNLTTSITFEDGPQSIYNPSVSRSSGPSVCPNAVIYSWTLNTSPNYVCSNGSLANGDNSRTTGIGKNPENGNGVGVYPNPTTGKLTVDLKSGQAGTIELYDTYGRLVKAMHSAPATGEVIDFNALGVQNGVYYIKTVVNNESTTQKVTYIK